MREIRRENVRDGDRGAKERKRVIETDRQTERETKTKIDTQEREKETQKMSKSMRAKSNCVCGTFETHSATQIFPARLLITFSFNSCQKTYTAHNLYPTYANLCKYLSCIS